MRAINKQRSTKKSLGRLLLTIYLGVFLVLILAWGINLGWHTIHLLGLARSLQESQTQIQPDTILPLVEDAAHDIGAIHRQLSPLYPIFNALQGLPGIGPYLGQIEPLLSYADGLSQAGNEISLGLEPLLEESPAAQATLSLPERLSQVLQSGQAHFVDAAQTIDQTSQVRSRIQPDLLPAAMRLRALVQD